MSWPITRLTIDEFDVLLAGLNLSRKIDCVHLHHTWRPNHAQWRGKATVEAMRRVHMQERGFSDIAQHLTIDPYGGLWTGRDFNRAPASARGHNGNSESGPFMIEMVGDFDDQHDVLAGPQKDAVIAVIALLIWRCGLGLAQDSVLGHMQMAGKSCPGSSLTAGQGNAQRLNLALSDAFDAAAANLLAQRGVPGALPPHPVLPPSLQPLAVSRSAQLGTPSYSAEPAEIPEDVAAQVDTLASARMFCGLDQRGARGAVDVRYAPLYGHVLNTSRGLLLESPLQLGKSGKFYTSQDELAGDFFRALREFESGLAHGQPLRLMLHAHGGLVSEGSALDYAREHLDWWKRMQVFPIYLIWETGLLETVFESRRELDPSASRGPLDWLFDRTDWLIEKVVGSTGR